MTRLRLCLATALRYAVLEQVRNRLALALAVFFVPVWVGLAHTAMPTAPVRFFLRAADQDVTVAGNVLTQLSGAVHALALIVGFMMFLAARRSAAFDHRLVTAGYPRACLVLAKYLALLLACLLVAGYATAWICVFWRPEQPALLAAALGAGALTYGGAGIMLAALLRSELAGMFLVIMASFVDVSLQNPIANAGADSPVLRWLPTYGAMQSAVVAADIHHLPWAHLGLALLWALTTAAVGTAAFTLHTRSRLGALRRTWRLPPLRHRVYRRAGVDDPELRAGYETCRRLVRRSGQTDYAVTQLVPTPLRPLLWAMYGHGRVLDDLSDSGRADATERIDAWVRAMEEDLARGTSTDPVRRALTHAVTTWDLPTEQLPASFATYRQDAAERPDFTSWEQWHAYWHALSFPVGVTRLATLLGEATGTRLGPRDAEALRRWTDAFNLVDALRDLRQDARLGRVALPLPVLAAHGVHLADLRTGRRTPQLDALVRELAVTAHGWLDDAAGLADRHPVLAASWRTLIRLQRLQLGALERGRPLSGGRRCAGSFRRALVLHTGRLRAARYWRRLGPVLAPAQGAPVPAPPPPVAPAVPRPRPAEPPLPPRPHAGGARPPAGLGDRVPRHVAIIMDGNGRWAAERGLPRSRGHGAGQAALRDVVYGALELGIPHLTLYGLSTENWKRPAAEVEEILRLLGEGADADREEVFARDVRLWWSGLPEGLPAGLLDVLESTVRRTGHRRGLTLTLCVNYGGRAEITAAARELARDVADGGLRPSAVTAPLFARYLHQPTLPDVDLLIRTGGDHRLSNFLPWQAAYAELVFLDTLWPDLDRTGLWRAVETYARRERRFGGLGEAAAQGRIEST